MIGVIVRTAMIALTLFVVVAVYPQSENRVELLTRADYVTLSSNEQVAYVGGVADFVLLQDTHTDLLSKDGVHPFLVCNKKPESPFADPQKVSKIAEQFIKGDSPKYPPPVQHTQVAGDVVATLILACEKQR